MRLVLVLLLALLLGALIGAEAQERAHTLAMGRLGGTDQELQECYFAIGGSMLILNPKGEPCQMARDLVGRTGKLMFVLDPPIASPSR